MELSTCKVLNCEILNKKFNCGPAGGKYKEKNDEPLNAFQKRENPIKFRKTPNQFKSTAFFCMLGNGNESLGFKTHNTL